MKYSHSDNEELFHGQFDTLAEDWLAPPGIQRKKDESKEDYQVRVDAWRNNRRSAAETELIVWLSCAFATEG
jgi:hypothetical protein